MVKLGKKARKFARKNLQSVMRRKRKLNSKFRKKNAPRNEKDVVEDQGGEDSVSSSGRMLPSEDLDDASLDMSSSEDDDDMVEDGSDSEGYLSEDPSCLSADGNENEAPSEDNSQGSGLSIQNQKLQSELSKKKKRLEALKLKDPDFATYLQDHIKSHKLQNDDISDEDEMSNQDIQSAGTFPTPEGGRVLNVSAINSWCQIVKEQRKPSALPSLLNVYRAACQYGAESRLVNASIPTPVIQNKETFCRIVMFMLSEGDNLFRGLLGVSSSCKMDAILNLKGSSKWESVKPMIKSYLNSTLFLISQFSETDILAFALARLRASLIFFAPFPSLLHKLMEVAVHLWATGGGALSSCSFLVLHDMASSFDQDCYDRCLRKTYKAIISHCKVVDPTCLKHIDFLKTSFVELCSLHMQRSIQLAMVSTQKLARILQLGLLTKKKEALKKICSWEYAVCIDLWVTFLSVNIKDNDLHGLLYAIIQVILGVNNLFAGQRYLPLKVKCLQWLNRLSSSSGIFIPISSLALDILESSPTKEVAKPGKGVVNLSTTLKLPKYWLKSRDFQGECVLGAVELLSAHFLQWSHHISFPELATVPVIRLKRFHDKLTVESLRRTVKRLLDQVEKNIDFVQRKREDVSFTPKDQASADSFLQIEKSGNAPFIQYYKSTIENAASRMLTADNKSSLPEKKSSKRKRKSPQKTKDASTNGKGKSEKTGSDPSIESQGAKKSKKQRT